MIKNNRVAINFSLSVLEREQASKLINDYKKEFIKPYEYIFWIKKVAFFILAFAALANVIILIQFSFRVSLDDAFLARTRVVSIIALSLFGIALVLFKIYDVVSDKVMRKQAGAEQEDAEILQRIKLNRYFIENVTNTLSWKVWWQQIKASYRKEGFIFLHMLNDNCMVIPERVFSSESEIVEVFDFITLQMARNK